jgi:hypothetical protein
MSCQAFLVIDVIFKYEIISINMDIHIIFSKNIHTI